LPIFYLPLSTLQGLMDYTQLSGPSYPLKNCAKCLFKYVPLSLLYASWKFGSWFLIFDDREWSYYKNSEYKICWLKKTKQKTYAPAAVYNRLHYRWLLIYYFVLYGNVVVQQLLFLSMLKPTQIKNCWHNRSKILMRRINTKSFGQNFQKKFAHYCILLHSFFSAVWSPSVPPFTIFLILFCQVVLNSLQHTVYFVELISNKIIAHILHKKFGKNIFI